MGAIGEAGSRRVRKDQEAPEVWSERIRRGMATASRIHAGAPRRTREQNGRSVPGNGLGRSRGPEEGDGERFKRGDDGGRPRTVRSCRLRLAAKLGVELHDAEKERSAREGGAEELTIEAERRADFVMGRRKADGAHGRAARRRQTRHQVAWCRGAPEGTRRRNGRLRARGVWP